MAQTKDISVPPQQASVPRAPRATYERPRIQRRNALQLVTLISGIVCHLDC